MWPNKKTSAVVFYDDITNPITILGRNFGVDERFCTKFGIMMENRQPNGTRSSEVRFSKIQDGERPPSWISILGHNFGVDQHFCTKFGTQMENRQPSDTDYLEIRFSKVQNGGRPPFLISFWAIISASTNIFLHYIWYSDEKSQPKATSCSESSYRKSKITDCRHFEFQEKLL